MSSDVFHEALLDAIREKIPEDTNIANALMDILFIGKEAIYRRLRGEVPFTLIEASIIAKKLGVSMDSIFKMESQKNRPFQVKLVEYSTPTDVDYAMLQNYIDLLSQGKDHLYSEFTVASNTFPRTIYINFEYITKFYLFKWAYHHGRGQVKSYSQIHISDRLKEIHEHYFLEHTYIKTTCYILDSLLSLYLVNDIKYFASIRLISEEDLENIKVDFYRMLDFMENLAATAKFNTGMDVYMYISNINLENTYSYLQINNYKLSLIDAFVLNSAASLDHENFDKLKAWVSSLKRLSILISESGELQRVKFFRDQRKIVDSLHIAPNMA